MPTYKYEADDGDIKPIRMSATTFAAAGDEPAGNISDPDFVKISKSNREFGIRPRGVRLSRQVGAAPNLVTKYKFLPVLTAAQWDGAPFALNAEVTVGGVKWTVAAKVPEDY